MSSDLDRLKRAVWDSASGLADISNLWGDVREVAPHHAKAEQAELLRGAVLELLDEDLIYAYWADWDNGPKVSRDSVEHLDRARVDRYFTEAESDTAIDDQFLWVGETSRGAELWPPD